jgi:hypothetical protein
MTEEISGRVASVEVLQGRIEFTRDQLFTVATLIAGPQRAQVLEYLRTHYGILITAEIHDSATIEVPTSVTATDASVIVTELQALFG